MFDKYISDSHSISGLFHYSANDFIQDLSRYRQEELYRYRISSSRDSWKMTDENK